MEKKLTRREENERRDTILVGILVVLCLVLFGIGSIFSSQIQGMFSSNTGGVGGSPGNGQEAPPTATPQPTDTPVPTPTEESGTEPDQGRGKNGAGLGVAYEEIRATFEAEGFTFTETKSDDNVPHYQGRSGNGMAAIQVSGVLEDVNTAAIVVYIVREKPEMLEKNLGYASKMLKTVLPNWKEGHAWFYSSIANLSALSSDPRETSTMQENVKVRLRLSAVPEILYLSFEAQEP